MQNTHTIAHYHAAMPPSDASNLDVGKQRVSCPNITAYFFTSLVKTFAFISGMAVYYRAVLDIGSYQTKNQLPNNHTE
jgi:hypothetical protein